MKKSQRERTTVKTVNVEFAAKALGIGRSLAYDLARRGELPGVIRLGHRFVVSEAALQRTLLAERDPVEA